MDELQNFEKIGFSTKTQSDLSQQSENHSKIADQFEGRLFNSLMIGSGAALAFVLGYQFDEVGISNGPILRIISAWLFLISLCLAFVVGVLFSIHSRIKSDELSTKSNLETRKNSNLDSWNEIRKYILIYPKFLRLTKQKQFESINDEKFLLDTLQEKTKANFLLQIKDERETLPLLIKKFEKEAKLVLMVTRIILVIAIVCFVMGLIVPMFQISREILCQTH